jgi:hypothetical protein
MKWEHMRAELPYGVWECDDGTRYLFNRKYEPIWRRTPAGVVSAVVGKFWVHWAKQEWFYNDDNPPWRNSKTRKLCETILDSFTSTHI